MSPEDRQDFHGTLHVEDEQTEPRTGQYGAEARPPSSAARPTGRTRHAFWLAVIVILVAAVIAWGVAVRKRASANVERDTQELAVITVSVVHPKLGAAQEEIPLPANIQPWIDAPIYARTNGYLKRRYVDIGSRVRKGDLLAEIDTPEIDQQLQQARADLNTARANYHLAEITAARYENLLKSDAVSQQDTDNAVGEAKARQAMVESARFNVKRLEELQSFQKIYAPFDGVITARNTDVGALINSGNRGPAQELFHMASTRVMRVYVNVPQAYSLDAKPGLTADLTLAERPNQKFTGKLLRTSKAIDPASRTLLAEFDVENPTGALLPGAYAILRFRTPNEVSRFVLPVNTLIFRSQGLQVGVVKDDHVELISITAGRDYGTEVEVTSGLNGNESVVVSPPDSLTSGQRVRIGSSRTEEGKEEQTEGKGK